MRAQGCHYIPDTNSFMFANMQHLFSSIIQSCRTPWQTAPPPPPTPQCAGNAAKAFRPLALAPEQF